MWISIIFMSFFVEDCMKKKKHLFNLLMILVVSLSASTMVYASGNGNIDGGGGGMGQGTSQNFWSVGNDGVRITVVDSQSGTAATSSVDFSNKVFDKPMTHFIKNDKIAYRAGTPLAPGSGDYVYSVPSVSIPIIITSNSRPANINAIRSYFCSEYAARMVADEVGMTYENLTCGEYKLIVEPMGYFTYNGNVYAMSATEAALYNQLSNGDLASKLPSIVHRNLPLSIFLQRDDLGFPAWTGPTNSAVTDGQIISSLGIGIVSYDPKEEIPELEAPDCTYRVNTDVITSVTLHTGHDLTPDNPASVRFFINGSTYTVNNVVIPDGDSQVVWVKWHTPSTPQTITIRVSVSGAYTAQDTFVAKIVDLNDNSPPDPLATDTYPGYMVPPLPDTPQKTTANWGVWSCYWVPVWVWCDHSTEDDPDAGHWVDEGYWEFKYTGYSARLSGSMTLMPDDLVPTASRKTMKSGYGVKTEVSAVLSTSAPGSHYTYTQTALSTFPEFQYKTYSRLLERFSGGFNAKFRFKPNEFSIDRRNVHFLPVWFPDGKRFTVYTQAWDTWTPDGMLSVNVSDYISIQGSLFDDWYTSRE